MFSHQLPQSDARPSASRSHVADVALLGVKMASHETKSDIWTTDRSIIATWRLYNVASLVGTPDGAAGRFWPL